MYNLEQSIAEWRQQMLAAGIKATESLDELESHLREELEQQIKLGYSPEQAFQIAVQQIGRAVVIKQEFAKAAETKWAILQKFKAMLLGLNKISGASLASLEKWAPAAQQTLGIAGREARSFHHNFVGTEHILLGLIKSQSVMVSNVLQRLGVESQAIHIEIEKMVGKGPTHEVSTKIPYTPRVKKALYLAAHEARALNNSRINPGHILLGLILVGDGVAAQALKNLGVQLENARKEMLIELRTNPGAAE